MATNRRLDGVDYLAITVIVAGVVAWAFLSGCSLTLEMHYHSPGAEIETVIEGNANGMAKGQESVPRVDSRGGTWDFMGPRLGNERNGDDSR